MDIDIYRYIDRYRYRQICIYTFNVYTLYIFISVYKGILVFPWGIKWKGRLLNVLCTFNWCLLSRGYISMYYIYPYIYPYIPDIHPWSDVNNKDIINSRVFVNFEKSWVHLLLPCEAFASQWKLSWREHMT